MLTFIKKIIAGQKRIYVIMTVVLSILSSFEWVLVNMYNSASTADPTSEIIIKLIPTITIFVSFFVTLLINNYFVESKTEEFSIILLSGRNLKQILKYVVIQFGVLFLITACIGGVIGMGLLYTLNLLLPWLGSNTLAIIDLNQIIPIFIAILFMKIIYVFLLNFGTFIRIKMDIAIYMYHSEPTTSTPNYFSQFRLDKKKKKFPLSRIFSSVFAIFLIIISLDSIVRMNGDANNLIPYFSISLCGELMLLNSTIPLLYDILHDRFLLKHPTLLLGMNQLIDLSKVMVSIITINSILIPIMFEILILPFPSSQVETVVISCYFILMGIIFLSFIVRFSVYLPTKTTDIATLKAIGYQEKQIRRIQNIEISGFLLFIVGLPIIIYSFVLYKGYHLHLLTLQTVYLLIGSYIVLNIVLCGFMIMTYKHLTKEVFSNVKYLNRGE